MLLDTSVPSLGSTEHHQVERHRYGDQAESTSRVVSFDSGSKRCTEQKQNETGSYGEEFWVRTELNYMQTRL